MNQAFKYFQLTASAIAACLVVSACGGGAAEAPPPNTPPVIADTTPPTVVITDTTVAATATGPVTFAFAFSEDVGTSFTLADVVVSGGTSGVLTKVDAKNYTLAVTPTANTAGSISVSVAAGTFSDLASNSNTAAATASQAYNTAISPSGSTGTCNAATCIDFSGNISFALFENVGGTAALVADPKDATNKVAKFTKTSTDKEYFGTPINGGPGSVVLTATSRTVTMRVLSPAVGTNMLLKFEGGAGGATTEIDVLTTKADEWETLTFVMPAAGTYSTVVLFPNGRSLVAANKDIYIDEIKFPAVAAPVAISGSTGTCNAATCIDFSGNISFALFENVGGTAALVADPKNATNKVAKFTKTPTDKEYFGTPINGGPGSVVLTAANRTVTMRVLSPAVGTNMLLKFEGGAGGATTEIDVLTTKADEWETLTFVLPATGTYSTIVLFPNGRSLVTANKDIYIDEIKFPAVAAPVGVSGNTGTCNAATCIDFSGNISFSLFENAGGSAAIALDPKDGANKVAKFTKTPTDKEYFGTPINGGPGSVVLTTANKTVTMRVLSPAVGTNMLLKFEGGAGGATTEIDVLTTKADEWETLTFVLPAPGTYSTIVLFPNGRSLVAANKDIYIDEIKFPAVVAPVVVATSSLPITFDETPTPSLKVFGGVEDAVVVADPTNAANKVVKVVKSATAETWAGTTFITGANDSIATIPFSATATKMTVRVWTPAVGIAVRLKVETAGDTTRSVETDAITTVANGWETLTFNFTNQGAGTAPLNLSFTYNKASIFFNYGKSGAQGGGGTYYFDQVAFLP